MGLDFRFPIKKLLKYVKTPGYFYLGVFSLLSHK